MTIKEIKITELKPYENNPRFNDSAVNAVANSIREFGFKVPIIIDKENVIVAGHTRLKAAQMLKLDKVPCIVADDLNEDQIKAFRLADNKVGEIADWNYELLEAELQSLVDKIDMSDFGFAEIEKTDIDDFFELKPQSEAEKKPEIITCPFCGKEFERQKE